MGARQLAERTRSKAEDYTGDVGLNGKLKTPAIKYRGDCDVRRNSQFHRRVRCKVGQEQSKRAALFLL